jgi:N-methylhydantoinase B
VTKCEPVAGSDSSAAVDAITTEVIRNGLNSAAQQMRRALIRTAFSPTLYEMIDFAVALYDREVRLLAQSSGLPIFMGSLGYATEAAVEAVGGEAALEPGDILLYNVPYLTGSHPQDAGMVMPVFMDNGGLVGYASIKAHWMDLGAKAPYCTDTTDVFQEGTIFPGVKLCSQNELVSDIYRTILANSRLPATVGGDLNAEIVGVRTGAREFKRVVERYGYTRFRESITRMYDHGEAVVRRYIEALPDGSYSAEGLLDSNGQDDVPLEYEVTVVIEGSTIRLDYTNAPVAQPGPVNCTLPDTVSASRIAVMALAGGGEQPCEGHFRPLEVVTAPGTMFHALPPAPCYLCGFLTAHAIEVAYLALGQAIPEAVPASSGGDLCAFVHWGYRESGGEPWADSSVNPVGLGAHVDGDGANSLMHISIAGTQVVPVEVAEARNPWLFERFEFAPDSGGVGKHRGGLGIDVHVVTLEGCLMTSLIDRTLSRPRGLNGGGDGRANAALLRTPDGAERPVRKETGTLLAKGSRLEISTGGGGGWGPPAERSRAAIANDVADGYVTREQAAAEYGFDEK